MSAPPLSLYVHLPWCVRKCPYCDFNSHRAGNDPPLRRYVDALLLDLESEARRAAGRRIETVFLGGGTPSLFPPAEIGRLLEGVAERLALADDAEITMEANPGTVDCGAPAAYRAVGVNRLSIGAQSFDDGMLERLGRIHRSADIVNAVEASRSAGFDNLNIDLMHGLPAQAVGMALADLRAAVALEPTHISWYQLTLEPNTVFYAHPPGDLPDEDELAAIQDAGAALLNEQGFVQYEVSAWARDGRQCRHNRNYWLFGDYLAIGAGAHGKLSDSTGVRRYRKPANPAQYMNDMESGRQPPLAAVERDDLVFEFMLNALRLTEGFTEADFHDRTGLAPGILDGLVAGARAKGLLEQAGQDGWRPTDLGRRFLNDLQAEFLAK